MGQIGEGASDAVPDLIQALQDQDHQVRMNAASALGSIGSEVVVPALIQLLLEDQDCGAYGLLVQDHQVRMNAASTLGSIGSEVAVPALIKLLQDPNAERFGSVSVLEEALGKIGTPEALKAIEEYESQ